MAHCPACRTQVEPKPGGITPAHGKPSSYSDPNNLRWDRRRMDYVRARVPTLALCRGSGRPVAFPLPATAPLPPSPATRMDLP